MIDHIFVMIKQLILQQAGRFLHGPWLDLLSMVINMAAILLFAPLLAQHWDDADEPQRAFDYYLRAGDTAARKYANAEAMRVAKDHGDLSENFE